jgi:hypothetical protein
MKINIYYLLLLLFSIPAIAMDGQASSSPEVESLALFAKDSVSSVSLANFHQLNRQLSRKRQQFSKESDFLYWAFYYVHRRYLKRYTRQSTLSDLLEKGRYNCVTASALYALLFEQLNIRYQIWEMDYHAYISVETDGKMVMLETTDPMCGFVTEPAEIRRQLNEILTDARQYQRKTGMPMPLIHRVIQLHQLAGLQFYNLAIDQYIDGHVEEAHRLVIKALACYPASRLYALEQLLTWRKERMLRNPFALTKAQ